MVSVTARTRKVKQPYGGYLPVKQMDKFKYEDDFELNNTKDEFLSPVITGLAVDYLTRLMLGNNKKDVFYISLRGAQFIKKHTQAIELLENINGLDSRSIVNACKLVGFDTVFRAGPATYKPIENIMPSDESIEDIKIMVNRTIYFFNDNGPIILSGFTFEEGYSSIITTGDADFLTSKTLWDLKVSKNSISSKHTLQVLVYYLMGLKSIHKEHFENLETIGLFNPKLNIAYIKDIIDIDEETMIRVSKEVICYK